MTLIVTLTMKQQYSSTLCQEKFCAFTMLIDPCSHAEFVIVGREINSEGFEILEQIFVAAQERECLTS